MSTAALAESQPDVRVAWSPQGWQWEFLSCPVPEIMLHGNRGGGKTEAPLAKFERYCNIGYGSRWRGIVFRRHAIELNELIRKTRAFFADRPIECKPEFNKADKVWTWPGGEQLLLRHMRVPDDYWNFHGWELPFIFFDELTAWPTLECYDLMKSCWRASFDGPRFLISATNPKGKGHNVVKQRFIDPAPDGKPVRVVDEFEVPKEGGGYEVKRVESVRVRLFAPFSDNIALQEADPGYQGRMLAGVDSVTKKAWGGGEWDIPSGGIWDDLYRRRVHCIPSFPIPQHWTIFRAMDWGSAKPFSVGWYAVADDTLIDVPLDYPRPGEVRWKTPQLKAIRFVPGTIIRVREWYGWNGTPNVGCRMTPKAVAKGIADREEEWGWENRVQAGPADGIWTVREHDIDQKSHSDDFAAEGVRFVKPNKDSGSRVRGWQQIRNLLEAALDEDSEDPGLFAFEEFNPQFVRTFPTQQRDSLNPDDIDTEGEDHLVDEARYACTWKRAKTSKTKDGPMRPGWR